MYRMFQHLNKQGDPFFFFFFKDGHIDIFPGMKNRFKPGLLGGGGNESPENQLKLN